MRRKKKNRSTKKRRKTSRRHPRRRRLSAKRSARARKKKRRFSSATHKYTSEVFARKRREDVREYGSVSAARKARREQGQQESAKWKSDEAAWRAAFYRRHGHAPDSTDWMTDYNYTWRDRYASIPTTSAPSRNERLVEKLRRLANDPGATPAERDNARLRIAELS